MQMEDEVEEEFSVWKKNTPLLYDLVICHSLEWPSLTVQWLPLPPSSVCSDFSVHKIILGTHTSDESPNFLLVADAYMPRDPSPSAIEVDLDNLIIPKVEITQRMHVDGEVNRARCMPQIPTIVAAKTCGTEVYVFDSKKQMDGKSHSCEPDLRLRGHDKEGYGLSWSSLKEGNLLSGSNDGRICLWNVCAKPEDRILDANYIYEGHEDVVEDVSWHSKNECMFGSVGDDGKLIIWDTRTNKFQHSVVAHEKEVNYLCFNPFNEWVVATASSDTTVGIFDIRNLSCEVHGLESHMKEVFQVEWDPNHETILASSADDRRLIIWDLNKVGEEQWDGEAEDGPPELLFSHGGHRAKISDFSWNTFFPWTVTSVAEDNTLQVWQLGESIYRVDD